MVSIFFRLTRIAAVTAIFSLAVLSPTLGASTLPITTAGLGVGGMNFSNPESVSCFSSSYCVAGGTSGNSAVAWVYNGTNWSSGQPLIADSDLYLNYPSVARVQSVSCPSAGLCVAGGIWRDQYFDIEDFVSVYNGTSWSTSELGRDPGNVKVNSVSCASASFCVAGGSLRTGDFSYSPFTSVFDGTGWTDQSPWEWASGATSEVNSISCISASFCVAGGDHPSINMATPQAFVSIFDGSNWSFQDVTASLNSGHSAKVNSVSCLSRSFCVAGGYFTNWQGQIFGFVSI